MENTMSGNVCCFSQLFDSIFFANHRRSLSHFRSEFINDFPFSWSWPLVLPCRALTGSASESIMDALDYGKSFQFSRTGALCTWAKLYTCKHCIKQNCHIVSGISRQQLTTFRAVLYFFCLRAPLPRHTRSAFVLLFRFGGRQRKAVNSCRRSLYAISWSSTICGTKRILNTTYVERFESDSFLSFNHFNRVSWCWAALKKILQTDESKRWVS